MNPKNKFKILTNFGYQRKNWIYPFESIKEEFDVVYIHFNTKEDEYEKYTDSETLYYSDFKNAQELLRRVNPDIFIAMGLNSIQVYAIRYACKKKRIPFVFMDHGLHGSESDNKKKSTIQAPSSQVNKDSQRSRNYTFGIQTYLSAFNFLGLILLTIHILYSRVFKKPLPQAPFKKYLIKPDKFISYSKQNNRINQSMFSPSSKDVIFIGNFEYDKFRVEPVPTDESYMLLIDSPLSDNPSNITSFSTDTHINIYKRVGSLARSRGVKLKVKLHPYNYYSEWVMDGNSEIEFIKDADINSLIKNANYCVGFYSTLLVPALYFVPTIVLKYKEQTFLDFIEKENLCNIYLIEELFHEDVVFTPVKANVNNRFKDLYFDLDKQPSIQRLKAAIYDIIDSK